MPDVYVAEILGAILGQPCASVLHFEGVEDTGENPIEACDALIEALDPAGGAGTYVRLYLEMTCNSYIMKGIRCRRIATGGGPNVAQPIDNQPGERTGVSDYSGPGPVILWHCQDTGSKWRTGKLFVPGAATADVTANVFAEELVDACNAFGDLFGTPIGAGPHGPFTQKIWSPTDTASLTIISNSVSAKVGTQRRRYVPL